MNRFREFEKKDDQKLKRRRPQSQPRRQNDDEDDFDHRRYRCMDANEIVKMIDERETG